MSNQAQGLTPEEPASSRKRKRKTYSCLDCRRRKLKCDREHPCGRCVKEGHSESCAFRDDGHNSETEEHDVSQRSIPLEGNGSKKNAFSPTDRSNGTSPFTTDQSAILHRKIALLESKLAKYQTMDPVEDYRGQDSSVQQDKNTTYFRGKSFRTSFYGPTNPGSLFAHVR